ncbi:MAG: hypothetical protein IIB95_13140 [Candidatus Marinimicrobia bacterium]|nr:hypothetical protein [Candidatus Neomarinimicrobiota bacterium]
MLKPLCVSPMTRPGGQAGEKRRLKSEVLWPSLLDFLPNFGEGGVAGWGIY